MAAPRLRQSFAKFFTFLLLSTLVSECRSWDSDDFELFDLVEEINKNFYEVLGVKEDATTTEIRRAYRKLSLQLHPDKNPAADAEVQFRNLVAVYETLKDETKREKYNNLLVTGLPDWRQPIFYYRRVRKLGLAELAVLLFFITTIAQYLFKWAVYFEKRLTLDDMMTSFRRKSERRKKKARPDDDPDVIEETLINQIPKPMFRDLLPFQIWRLTYFLITESPRLLKDLVLSIKEYRTQTKEEENESDIEEEVVERTRTKPKRRQIVSADDDLYKQTAEPVTYTHIHHTSTESSRKEEKKKGDWTNEDFILLSKAVSKFPGGTVDRWEKIGEFVGRPQNEVMKKSKSLQTNYTIGVDPSLQGTTGAGAEIRKARTTLTDDMVTTRDSATDTEPKERSRKSRPHKNAERTLLNGEERVEMGTRSDNVSDSSLWTQDEQKCLEKALVQYPKGTDERWEKISALISNKSKEQCVERFKHLAAMLKKKRELQQQATTIS